MREVEDLSISIPALPMPQVDGESQPNPAVVPQGNLQRSDSIRDIIQLLKQELMQNESGSGISRRAFDWLSWEPAPYYHPMCWVQAVDGTLKTPKSKSTNKLPPQLEIIKYLAGMNEKELSETLEWHLKRIGKVILEDLDYVSMFDLVAKYDYTFYPKDISFKRYD